MILGFRYQLAVLFTVSVLLVGCGTTDGTMRDQGHNESYVLGFHDGRHSGMKEAGNDWEHYVRDHDKFAADKEYAAGWTAGEAEGQRIQEQAQSMGEAIGTGYTSYRVGEEVEKNKVHPHDIAKDAMKNIDTKDFDQLGK